MKDSYKPVLFDDDGFPDGIHLCYIYNDDQEREKTMAAFFASGIAKGEKILSIVDSVTPHDVRTHMQTLGVELEAGNDVFSLAQNDDSYCPNGHFSPDELLNGVGDFCRTAREMKFNGARISGDMAWVLRHGIKIQDLMVYETKVLEYLKTCLFTAICEYDARKFDGSTIMDVLSVHPAMIVQGQVVKNPFFMNPQDFLKKYSAA